MIRVWYFKCHGRKPVGIYISFGKPMPALGVDVGEGVIVRYDEKAREVVGLTLIGVGKRMEEYIRKNP